MAAPRTQQSTAEDTEHAYVWAAVRTIVPVFVKIYDDVRNVATVSLIRQPLDERGRPIIAPTLIDLPVAWPRGGGWIYRGFLQPGDLCLLLVSDRELAPQLLGPTGIPLPGSTRRMHDLSDGIVIPLGLSTATNPITPSAGVPLIGREDGSVAIKFTPADMTLEAPLIKLGLAAALGAARIADKTVADTAMSIHIPQAQTVLAGAAAMLGLPIPAPATDFGVISEGSAKVVIE